MAKRLVHMAKYNWLSQSICGITPPTTARFTSNWETVTCPRCLKEKPNKLVTEFLSGHKED
jgi:hypothetical protein